MPSTLNPISPPSIVPLDFANLDDSGQQTHQVDADEDTRGIAEATALIGSDVPKGLVEVRRLKAEAEAAYAVERWLEDEFARKGPGYDTSNPEPYLAAHSAWPGMRDAEARADEAGHHLHYALMHVWHLPIRSVEDIAAKVRFAIENKDYAIDEDLESCVIKQIDEFFSAPSVARQ